ncbi:hypothetical protein MTO96_042624 [Rhipicephalus appendiculatus]
MASSEPCGRIDVKNKNGRRYCSVKDCHSHEGTPGVKLYSFPSKPWEKSRRQKWITAVRRVKWKQRHSSSSAPSAALSSPVGVTSPATTAPAALPGSPSLHTTETAGAIGTDLLYERSSTEGLDLLSTVAAEQQWTVKSAVKSVVVLSEKGPEQIQLVSGATLMGAVTSQEDETTSHETIGSNRGMKDSKAADTRWSACVIGDTSVGGADVSALAPPPDDCRTVSNVCASQEEVGSQDTKVEELVNSVCGTRCVSPLSPADDVEEVETCQPEQRCNGQAALQVDEPTSVLKP